MMEKFSIEVQELAREMALAVNGGDWDRDYSDYQKIGWCLKVEWAIKKFRA